MNLVDTIKQLYDTKKYDVKEDNYEFIVDTVAYTINRDYLNELYKPDERIDGVYQ